MVLQLISITDLYSPVAFGSHHIQNFKLIPKNGNAFFILPGFLVDQCEKRKKSRNSPSTQTVMHFIPTRGKPSRLYSFEICLLIFSIEPIGPVF